MDSKKVILVIILAVILAFVVAKFLNVNTNKKIPSQSVQKKEEIVLPAEEKIVEEKLNSNIEEQPVVKESVSNVIKSNNKASIEKVNDFPVFEPIKIEETVVQEAKADYIDPGIHIDPQTGEIIISREFKTKSPNSYSFKGYGTLDKVSTK